ncbi:MAG: helix-turn-helix transcriptional regulator [Marinagarivorans sp.]|nr:helix-turn-helix transcriptional regulator [Marinagarivorans sp.]
MELMPQSTPQKHYEKNAPSGQPYIDGELFFEGGIAVPLLQVHGSYGVENKNQKISADIPPGVTFGVILEGSVNFYLDGCHHVFNAKNGPQFFCYNLTQTTRFQKTLTRGQRTRKIIITVPHALLQHLLPEANATLQQFLNSHRQVFHRTGDTQLIDTAKSLLTLSTASSSVLLRDTKALEFLSLALKQFEGCEARCHSAHTAKIIHNYITTHLISTRNTLSLTDLAYQLNMSVSKMQRAFKAEFNQTIGEYVTQQRLKAARYALEKGEMSIGEAAFLAGYKHTSNFCAAYKKNFGVTPGGIFQLMMQVNT